MMIILAVMAAALPVLAQDDDGLANFDETPAAVMLELERSGVFPAGSAFAFASEGRPLIGGSQFTTLLPDVAPANFAFGGTLAFNAQSDDLETCALVARATVESDVVETDTERIESAQINSFVDVGLTGEGEVFVVDRFGDDDDALTIEMTGTEVDLSEPVRMIAVVLDDALSVYVDGERVIGEMRIEAPAGQFAFALETTESTTTCTGADFWAYTLEADYVREGCEITTVATINQRGGPGTQFDVLSQLNAGEVALATGQTVDAEGFTWWRLESNLWMREDVVTAQGYCRTLPQIPT
ncbi:MAG: hypothetical protein AAFV33_15090 [Chloroflexota bacterium]